MLSPTQRAMIDVLRHGQPIPSGHLASAIYGNRYDGGPDDAEHTMRNQIYRIREKLARVGIEIETVGQGRGSAGYRVNPAHRDALNELLANLVT